jgi:protein gp37
MGTDSKIEWTHHTFNPWRGCTKVAEGCRNCYAETLSKRNPGALGVWGPQGTRVVAAESTWREPLKWNAAAAAAGERHRVFCASLADVFEVWDGPVSDSNGEIWVKPYSPAEWGREHWHTCECDDWYNDSQGWLLVTLDDIRARLWSLIEATPWLDWLLLTKRPGNIPRMLPARPDGQPWPNVWLGCSAATQTEWDRDVPELLKARRLARVLFVSLEPLIERVDIVPSQRLIDWLIVGGESGPGARPCHVEWVDDLVEQRRYSGLPTFVKQLGSKPRCHRASDFPLGTAIGLVGHGDAGPGPLFPMLRDSKGGDPAEWPAELRVREFPRLTGAHP